LPAPPRQPGSGSGDDLGRRQPRQLGIELAGAQATSSKRPVEMSAAAIAAASPTFADRDQPVGRARVEQRLLGQRAGVTTRTIARSTTALEPRFLASAGLSVCSAMATRWPPLISRAR
jgi:hypothetical protein